MLFQHFELTVTLIKHLVKLKHMKIRDIKRKYQLGILLIPIYFFVL